MIMLIVKAAVILIVFITISDILYAIECALCELIAFLNELFEMFSGLQPITHYTTEIIQQYDPSTGGVMLVEQETGLTEQTTLLQMIFSNSTINTIYWDMALIGIAMVFGFAIFAVMKKMFDSRDKIQMTMGQIIGNAGKAIALICSMNLIVSVALTGSQTLLNSMSDIFLDAAGQDVAVEITFDEDDYAAMLRCVNTIANYSLNKNYNSRYNLNACFNDIREDLQYLEDKGKFRYPYRFPITESMIESGEVEDPYTNVEDSEEDIAEEDVNYDMDQDDFDKESMNDMSDEEIENLQNDVSNISAGKGNMEALSQKVGSVFETIGEVSTTQLTGDDSWQSVLYDIAGFNNGADVYLDSYDSARDSAILYAMDVIRNKADFRPLEKYTITRYGKDMGRVRVDRIIMLLGTMDAADNSKYNKNMSFTDELREPYLYGYKNIYSHSQMEAGFNYFIFVWHHILVIFMAILFLKQYLGMCFNAVARIFNMVFLYLIAPPFIAVMPLDDGGKAKQWTTSFIIQTFALFGTVLSMRLFEVLIPIVVSDSVIFFPNDSKSQMCAQVIFLVACAYVVKKAGGMITGILADNAGMQAINAGDMMAEAGGLVDTVKDGILGAASFVGSQAMGMAGDAAGMAGGGGGGGGGDGGGGGGEGAGA